MLLVISVTGLLIAVPFLIAYAITQIMLRPLWYKHKSRGHYNRDWAAGAVLPHDIIGDAANVWRVSETKNGLNDPQIDVGLAFSLVDIPLLKAGLPGNRKLRGWLVPARQDAGTKNLNDHSSKVCIVAIHGGGRDRRQWTRILPVFHDLECAVLCVDCEEHGLSDGKARRIGWATYEVEDSISAAVYVKCILHYEKVVLLGTSMGGSAVLIAADVSPFLNGSKDRSEFSSSCFDGVIAENPFSTRRELVEHLIEIAVGKSLGERAGLVISKCLSGPVTLVLNIRIGSYKYGEPLDAVKRIVKPILIIHGTADKLVPYSHGKKLYDAATGPKVMYTVEGAAHSATFNKEPDKWAVEIKKFLLQCI